MKLAPSMLFARIAFYLSLITLGCAVLVFTAPEWGRLGITPAIMLQLTDTLLLMSIAMLLANRAGSSD